MVSSKNIPIATIFAALLVCIGVGLTICSEYILKTINLIFYEKIAMLKYNPDNDGIVVFYIHAQMMTLVLALLVLLIVFAGAMYPLFSSEWMSKLRGEKPCLAFLILCVLFCAMWSFWTAEAVAGLYLANSSLRECSSYRFYAQKLPKSHHKFPFCLSLLRINDPFKRKICEPERINPYCDKIMTNTQLIYMLLVGGTSVATGGMFIFVICLSLNLVLSRIESDFDVETVVSCKHVPVASIVATFFVILGDVVLVSFKIIQNSNSAYFNDNITKSVNKFSDGVVFFAFLNLITLTLTIIVILTTFAGCIETDNEFLSKLRGEKPCLALLIIVILFSLFWSVIGSVMFSQLTLSNTIEKECKSYKYYLEKKSNDSLCISLIDVQDPSKRRLCDSNRIRAYCDVYSIDVARAVILGVIGVAFVNSGLFIYVICLSLNLVLIRVESTMDLESIGQCREEVVIFTIAYIMSGLTYFLAALVLLATWTGVLNRQGECYDRIRGKAFLLTLLIITIIFKLMWEGVQSADSLIFGYLTNEQERCNHFNVKNKSCLTISNLYKRNEKYELCDLTKIRRYCDNYIVDTIKYSTFSTVGLNALGAGLLIYSICLSINYMLVRFENFIDPEVTVRRRY